MKIINCILFLTFCLKVYASPKQYCVTNGKNEARDLERFGVAAENFLRMLVFQPENAFQETPIICDYFDRIVCRKNMDEQSEIFHNNVLARQNPIFRDDELKSIFNELSKPNLKLKRHNDYYILKSKLLGFDEECPISYLLKSISEWRISNIDEDILWEKDKDLEYKRICVQEKFLELDEERSMISLQKSLLKWKVNDYTNGICREKDVNKRNFLVCEKSDAESKLYKIEQFEKEFDWAARDYEESKKVLDESERKEYTMQCEEKMQHLKEINQDFFDSFFNNPNFYKNDYKSKFEKMARDDALCKCGEEYKNHRLFIKDY
ncbi:MAG: hypothetical protein AB8G05_15845 [Oligoflexales bacterium]